MASGRINPVFFGLKAALLAAALLGSGAASAQTPSIVVRPPPGSGDPSLAAPPGTGPGLDRGPPPTFEQYPLINRIFGFGGLVFPNYVSPSTGRNGPDRFAFVTGGGSSSLIFAAGTVDRLCQMGQVPTITVLKGPRTGRLRTDIGGFTATGTDAGSRLCVGRQVEGARIFYKGFPGAGGDSITVRVAYPPLGRSYTHTIPIR
ncbi:hypothetical protein MWN34_09300 [Ancylobacter sp. 6x-1]|uniref:Uncharacterized protein n=1 Tax=Ancylobacter crimeensis TaxID=2579147 RepID=A0ABT0DAX4_9HYPH|nr:hypothetical protein [Ancylobacter crimeensis]MCK0197106.1 hypothetical protein [Ancylobacter crimeensis]